MRRYNNQRIVSMLAVSGCLALSAVSASPANSLSDDAASLLERVEQSRDNGELPFMIIDKRRAHLWVFDRNGQLQGEAPVLLGLARGDDSAPGIGDKKLSEIPPEERTTPAGRFLAEMGRNMRGEDVVWVDYDGGVSMHRVLTTNKKEQRARRLATPTAADNRVSYGCINVPMSFYDDVVLATVRGGNSVIYVLPETRSLQSIFDRLAPRGEVRNGTR